MQEFTNHTDDIRQIFDDWYYDLKTNEDTLIKFIQPGRLITIINSGGFDPRLSITKRISATDITYIPTFSPTFYIEIDKSDFIPIKYTTALIDCRKITPTYGFFVGKTLIPDCTIQPLESEFITLKPISIKRIKKMVYKIPKYEYNGIPANEYLQEITSGWGIIETNEHELTKGIIIAEAIDTFNNKIWYNLMKDELIKEYIVRTPSMTLPPNDIERSPLELDISYLLDIEHNHEPEPIEYSYNLSRLHRIIKLRKSEKKRINISATVEHIAISFKIQVEDIIDDFADTMNDLTLIYLGLTFSEVLELFGEHL
jgi:hypothetical protein